MYCTYRYLISLFSLVALLIEYGIACDKFLVQPCIDMSIGFQSISKMKCIQFIPTEFDVLIQYSVKNYIIRKAANCYDIVSYDSPSTILFSNECRSICAEEYCSLFSNQPNTSIINIFYSESSTYELTNSTSNQMLSYDYLPLETCEDNAKNGLLLIIVYVLAGVIGFLTIGVAFIFIVAWMLRKRGYDPIADWRLLRDLLCCRLPPKTKLKNNHVHEPEPLYIIHYRPEPQVNDIQAQRQNKFNTSTQRYVMSTGSPMNTHDRRNYRNDIGSGTSSNLHHWNVSSEATTPPVHVSPDGFYYSDDQDSQNDNSLDETESHHPHHHQPLSVILHKLSSKASTVISAMQSSNGYDLVEPKISREYPIIRL